MSMMRKLIKKNSRGFSLVELIVVILIIGVLAIAIAPQVTKWIGNAGQSQKTNELVTVTSAVQVAVADFLSTGGEITGETTVRIQNADEPGRHFISITDTTTDGTEGSLLDKVKEVITDKPAKQVAVTITTAGGVTARRVE